MADAPNRAEYNGSSFVDDQGKICVLVTDLLNSLSERSRVSIHCESKTGNSHFELRQDLSSLFATGLTYSFHFAAPPEGGIKLFFTYVNLENIQEPSSWWIASIKDGKVDEQTLSKIETKESLISQSRPWLYPLFLGNDKTLLFYEWFDVNLNKNDLKYQRVTLFGEKVASGEVPQSLNLSTSAQLPRAGLFSSGEFAFGYQVGSGPDMQVFVLVEDPENVASGSLKNKALAISNRKNVHDVFFLNRMDGDLDVYFIVSEPYGFSLYRRSLTPNGEMGPPEKLSHSLNAQKPKAIRLPNKKIWLSFAVVSGRYPERTSGHYGILLNRDALKKASLSTTR